MLNFAHSIPLHLRTVFVCALLAFSLLSTPATAAGKGIQLNPDVDLMQLHGHWIYQRTLPNVSVSGIVSYGKQGKGSSQQLITLTVGDIPFQFRVAVEEEWRVEGHQIISKIIGGKIHMNAEERRAILRLYGQEPEALFLHIGKEERIKIASLDHQQLSIVLHGGKKGRKAISVHAHRVANNDPAQLTQLPQQHVIQSRL